jgi:hypothetical protein
MTSTESSKTLRMEIDKIRKSDDYSCFSNDCETFGRRRVAAGKVMLALQALPEYQHTGAVRSAAIKCELASKHAVGYKVTDGFFDTVAELFEEIITKG